MFRHRALAFMDTSNREILRMIDKMTEAGWIAQSASKAEGGLIQWTDDGKMVMTVLHQLMFESLHLQPGDESVFAWMVSDFPEGLRRVAEGRKEPPARS